jgi:thiol-disulfide isomerase/thioredoxin
MCDVSNALPYDRPLGLKMATLSGPDFDLTAYRGKAVLLNIFATWCGPCNTEMPYIVDAASTYAGRGLAVIGVDAGEADRAVSAFRSKYDITFPIAMDRSGGLTQALEVGSTNADSVFPVSLFIDPGGYLYCMQRGAMQKDELAYRVEHFLHASFPASVRPAPSPRTS